MVGLAELGLQVGVLVGFKEMVGIAVGFVEGQREGFVDTVGLSDGRTDGSCVGFSEIVGSTVDGDSDGLTDGIKVGCLDGIADGNIEDTPSFDEVSFSNNISAAVDIFPKKQNRIAIRATALSAFWSFLHKKGKV